MRPPDDRNTLRAALEAALARYRPAAPAGAVSVAEGIDRSLPGGGLARGAIHEVLDDTTGCCTAFCGHLLGRAGGLAAWIAPPRGADLPWPPGLAAFGLDPAHLLLIEAAGTDSLWAAEQALRSPALAAVVAVLPRLDLAAARRLQLAAEAGGTLGLLLRPGGTRPAPTAARTRWRVTPLPGRGGAAHRLGAPRWRLDLLLARGGRPASWHITFNIERKVLIVEETDGPASHA
jgi:protein ImuA